jgi:mono/diheme cytochrome c family protein
MKNRMLTKIQVLRKVALKIKHILPPLITLVVLLVGCRGSEKAADQVVDSGPQDNVLSAAAGEKTLSKKEGKMETGAQLYLNNCATCHQKGGEGDPYRFPPLSKSKVVSGNKDTLIHIALNGLQGPRKVNGNSYDGVMPSHSFLKNEELSLILTYIRQEWGNQASPVSSSDVEAIRNKL